MATKEDVTAFLNDFKIKYEFFGILFRDERAKNTTTLLQLDITPAKRSEIIQSITAEDYSEGPLDDTLYGIASMWVFCKRVKDQDIYIKISMGQPNNRVICISFHIAERRMSKPLK